MVDAETIRTEMQAKARARAAGVSGAGTSSSTGSVRPCSSAVGGVDVQAIRQEMQAKAASRLRCSTMSAATREPAALTSGAIHDAAPTRANVQRKSAERSPAAHVSSAASRHQSEVQAATKIQASYRGRSARRVFVGAGESSATTGSYDAASIRANMQRKAAERASALGAMPSTARKASAHITPTSRAGTGYDAASFKANMQRKAAERGLAAGVGSDSVRPQSETEAATKIQAVYRGRSTRAVLPCAYRGIREKELAGFSAESGPTDGYDAASIRASMQEKAAARVRIGTSSGTSIPTSEIPHTRTVARPHQRASAGVAGVPMESTAPRMTRVTVAHESATAGAASAADSKRATRSSYNAISRSVSTPDLRNEMLELQKETAVLLIQYQVRRRSKRALAAMLAEEERWHKEERAKLIGSLDFIDQTQEAIAEEEDASIVRSKIRSETWKGRNTGAALDAAMFVVADRTRSHEDGVAAGEASSNGPLVRSASYRTWQESQPAKGSELPWIKSQDHMEIDTATTKLSLIPASPRADAVKQLAGPALQIQWDQERAAWETERRQLCEQVQVQASELKALRSEMRSSADASTQEMSAAVAQIRAQWQREKAAWDSERKQMYAKTRAQAAEIALLQQSLSSTDSAGRGAVPFHKLDAATGAGSTDVALPVIPSATVHGKVKTGGDERILKAQPGRQVQQRSKAGSKSEPTQLSTSVGSLSKRSSNHRTRYNDVSVHRSEPEPDPEPESEPEPEPELKHGLKHEERRVEPSTHASLRPLRRQHQQLHISAAHRNLQPWALPSPRSLFRHRYLASIGAVESRQIILEPPGVRDHRTRHSLSLQQQSISSAGSIGIGSMHDSSSLPRRHRSSSRVHEPRRDVAIDNGGARPRLVMSGFGRLSL